MFLSSDVEAVIIRAATLADRRKLLDAGGQLVSGELERLVASRKAPSFGYVLVSMPVARRMGLVVSASGTPVAASTTQP